MSSLTAIGFDMGATTAKTGVVRDGKIILRGEIIDVLAELEIVPATLHTMPGLSAQRR